MNLTGGHFQTEDDMPGEVEKAILSNGKWFRDYNWPTDIKKDEYLDDFIKIATFLAGGNAKAATGLKALNAAMAKLIDGDLDKAVGYCRGREKAFGGNGALPAKTPGYSKVLSRVLAEAEASSVNNFKVTAPERVVPTLARFQSQTEFGDLLKGESHFKDV